MRAGFISHPLPMSLSKFTRSFFTWVFLVGVILVIGFLSFAGLLALYSSIALALIAFCLAGLIEGEVYKQNILKSINKLSGNGLEQEASLRLFNKLVKDKAISNIEFFNTCRKLHEAIEKAEKEAVLDPKAKELLERKQRALKYHQQYFHAWITGETAGDEELAVLAVRLKVKRRDNPFLPVLDKEAFKASLSFKKWFFRAGFLFSLVSGIGCGFVFLNVAQESILAFAAHFALSFSPTSLAFLIPIFGFAVISGIGYMLLVYNVATQVVQENILQKWWGKIKKFFQKKNNETPAEYRTRIALGVTLVPMLIGLCIFATSTIVGTWWGDAFANLHLLVPIFGAAAPWVLGTIIVITGITMLVFNLWSVVRAIKKISDLPWQELKEQIQALPQTLERTYKNLKNEENRLQIFNPIRLLIIFIRFIFKPIVFIGHTICTGLFGDRFEKIPAWLSAITGAITDTFVDGAYVFSENLERHEHGSGKAHVHHHQHKHEEECLHHHEHTHEETHYHKPHDHTHANIADWFLNHVLLLPLHFINATLDCVFSGLELNWCKALQKSMNALEILSKHAQEHHKETEPKVDEPLEGNAWKRVCAYKIQEKILKPSTLTKDGESLSSLRSNLLKPKTQQIGVFFAEQGQVAQGAAGQYAQKLALVSGASAA